MKTTMLRLLCLTLCLCMTMPLVFAEDAATYVNGRLAFEVPSSWTMSDGGEGVQYFYYTPAESSFAMLMVMRQDISAMSAMLTAIKPQTLYEMMAEGIASSFSEAEATTTVKLETMGAFDGGYVDLAYPGFLVDGFLFIQDDEIVAVMLVDMSITDSADAHRIIAGVMETMRITDDSAAAQAAVETSSL